MNLKAYQPVLGSHSILKAAFFVEERLKFEKDNALVNANNIRKQWFLVNNDKTLKWPECVSRNEIIKEKD